MKSRRNPPRLIFGEATLPRPGFLNQSFKLHSCNCQPSSALCLGNQGGAIMRTLGKIAATLGVIGAIAASSTVPAAAWYGYHHRHYHHHYYAYYPRHHHHHHWYRY